MQHVRKYAPDRFITPTPIKIKGYECIERQWAPFQFGDGYYAYFQKMSFGENVGVKNKV